MGVESSDPYGNPCLPSYPLRSRPSLANSAISLAAENELPGLLARLAEVPDPRKPRGVRHSLVYVPALAACAVCAVLTGATSLLAISEWAPDAPPAVLRCATGGPGPSRRAPLPAERHPAGAVRDDHPPYLGPPRCRCTRPRGGRLARRPPNPPRPKGPAGSGGGWLLVCFLYDNHGFQVRRSSHTAARVGLRRAMRTVPSK
ncbi:transposase family protein [Streptomyces sp. NPDC006332]|uniref:transposase family protein n=1 Tax=Streptomyces sp. NPDC006332 TaxID=3155456 RepID=UPI0033A7A288